MPLVRLPSSSTLETFGFIQFILFFCVWAGFGIFAFFLITSWGHEYDRKMALVTSGKVPEQALYVVSLRQGEDKKWVIGLNTTAGQINPQRVPVYKTTSELGDLALGKPVPAYRIEGEWFVPRFYTGGWYTGRWYFLAFGLVPPLVILAVALIRRRRRKVRETLHATP